jgi:hypothetical protein
MREQSLGEILLRFSFHQRTLYALILYRIVF